jgi:hypothetical protein
MKTAIFAIGALPMACALALTARADDPAPVEQAAIDAVWAAYPWNVQVPHFEVIHNPLDTPPGWGQSWKDWGNTQHVKPSNPCRGWNGTYFQETYTIYLLNITSEAVAKSVNAACWGMPGGYAVSTSDYSIKRLESLTAYELGHIINAAPDLSPELDAFVAQVLANVAAVTGSHDAPLFISWPSTMPVPAELGFSDSTWRLIDMDGTRRAYQNDAGVVTWVELAAQ